MSLIPHNRLTHGDAEVQSITEVVRSGYWACGPRTAVLEDALARRSGVTHAVSVASGSAALRLALKGLGVGRGESVLIPAYCCVALANAVLACGATPVLVEVRSEDWCIDPQAACAAAVASGARVAIVVNTFGMPASTAPIRRGGVVVIEDCAHAFGIAVEDGPLGGRSEAATLSFYATKLIGAGEGGAVLTNSTQLAEIVRESRDYTDRAPGPDRFNDKMTDLEAALALCQLARLEEMLARRKHLALIYQDSLARAAERTRAFRLPRDDRPRVWYRYVVEMRSRVAESVITRMEARGIHAAAPVSDWRSPSTPDCPIADRAYRYLVSLPLYPTLTEAEQERVIAEFLRICEGDHVD